MVTYRDVSKRHGFYASALIAVVVLAEHTTVLAVILAGLLAMVSVHMRAPKWFALFVSLLGPCAASVCVNGSHHTWWYAHGMPWLGVPLWLFPMHGLFGHWILDAYWVVSLTDVRKSTLP